MYYIDNHLAIGLLKETLDNPFNLFAGVAPRPYFQGFHALLEQTASNVFRSLVRWQHEVLVKLFESDRLENADGVIRLS